MKAPATLAGRIRLAFAGALLLIGSLATVGGALGLIVARLTGPDPRHGDLLTVPSALILAVGFAGLLSAAVVWPRKRSRKEPDATAA
jgi:hypothetical protein